MSAICKTFGSNREQKALENLTEVDYLDFLWRKAVTLGDGFPVLICEINMYIYVLPLFLLFYTFYSILINIFE